MTTTTATYDEPSVWAPLLVEWATQGRDYYLAVADEQRKLGHKSNAAAYVEKAGGYVWIADYGRARLVDVSGVSTDDAEQVAEINALTRQINDEPPLTLLALPGWLMRRMHGWLPWVRPETWQSFAAMVLADRERQS